MTQESWRSIWESKAGEPDFAASGRSSGDPGQLFALLADVCASLRPTSEDRLLDVGCGIGLLGRHLAPYAGCLVGVDFVPALLARARAQTPAAHYTAGSLLALPFATGAFSKLLVSSVLQYLGDESAIGRALVELRRVTSSGGRAFASGNPDIRKKQEYIAGVDRLDLPEERKELIRERNRKAFWLSPETAVAQAQAAGWNAEVKAISPAVWQSFYMFDLALVAR